LLLLCLSAILAFAYYRSPSIQTRHYPIDSISANGKLGKKFIKLFRGIAVSWAVLLAGLGI
jgi:hypothetical protein